MTFPGKAQLRIEKFFIFFETTRQIFHPQANNEITMATSVLIDF